MRFAVIVDDPQMPRQYGYVIEHDDRLCAAREAVRRAIIACPSGCMGMVELSEEERREQADDAHLVELMAHAWANVIELRVEEQMPSRLVILGGEDEEKTRGVLGSFDLPFELRRHDVDPHDWIATWPGGHETRVEVP